MEKLWHFAIQHTITRRRNCTLPNGGYQSNEVTGGLESGRVYLLDPILNKHIWQRPGHSIDDMRAGDLMSRNVLTVYPDDRVGYAARLMRDLRTEARVAPLRESNGAAAGRGEGPLLNKEKGAEKSKT